jgi:hypothetical protein
MFHRPASRLRTKQFAVQRETHYLKSLHGAARDERSPMVKTWTILGADRMDESLKDQLRATLDMIPAFTWFAAPSGAMLFVNSRCAEIGRAHV